MMAPYNSISEHITDSQVPINVSSRVSRSGCV